MTSVADAAGEAFKTTGKALDTVNGFGAFWGRMMEGPLLEFSGMIQDRLAFWRKLNLLGFTEKFAAKCAARGVSPETMEPLPPGPTIQALEAASFEDDDSVQELWADLLANAADPQSDVNLKKMYVTLLKDFGPADATLLRLLGKLKPYREGPIELGNDPKARLAELEAKLIAEAAPWRLFSAADRQVAIGNLRRLGCIRPHLPSPPQLGAMFKQVRLDPYARGPGSVVTHVDDKQFNAMLLWLQTAIVTAGGGDVPPLPESIKLQMGRGSLGPPLFLKIPEMNLYLTALGAELLEACAISSPDENPPSE